MKIIYANRKNDDNLIQKHYLMMDSENKAFKGKITLINIEKVNKSVVVKRPNGVMETIVDNNYKLLTYYPDKGNYIMTVFYDENDNIIQWYFDIVEKQSVDEEGIPYCIDMYLDIVLLTNGENYILDKEDIEKALELNIITKQQFDASYTNLYNLKAMIEKNFEAIKESTIESFNILNK